MTGRSCPTASGGYTWIFEKGDLEGKGHMDEKFRQDRPEA